MRCRRLRSPHLLVAALISTGACSPGYQRACGLADSNPRSITVALAMTPAVAQQRVQEAAAQGGWVVTTAQPGVVTIGPYQLPSDAQVKLTLHANIVAADSGAHVILSGTADDAYGEAIGHALERSIAGTDNGQLAATSRGEPIRQATKGRTAKWWAELERLAAAIRAAE